MARDLLDARPRVRLARFALAVIVSSAIAGLCVPAPACADGRFGDSTWAAPPSSIGNDSASDGPRVALPDRERPWETALRAPFRLVALPLRLVGNGLEASAGFLGPRYFDPKPKRAPQPGLTVAPHVTLGALNDIGVGPSLTWRGFPTGDSRARLSGSWSAIDRRRVSFGEWIGEGRPVGFLLRGEYDRKPNRRYDGIGNESSVDNASYYLLSSTEANAALLLGGSPLRQLRIEGGYSAMSPGRGYHGSPLLEDVFAPGEVPFEHQTTQVGWFGLSADLAALDEARDPSRGVHGRAAVRRATGLNSGDPDYHQWRLEGRAYIPVFAPRRVIALRGVYAGVDPFGSATSDLPFYRLAESDGANRFAGYHSERFRDRQLALARIEYRWAILYRMSAIALYELGQVAPRAGEFSPGRAHRSYGGGLRLGLTDVATLRLELAKSREGLHAVFSMGGDF